MRLAPGLLYWLIEVADAQRPRVRPAPERDVPRVPIWGIARAIPTSAHKFAVAPRIRLNLSWPRAI